MIFSLTHGESKATMLLKVESGIARMKNSEQQTPRFKGPRKPLVPWGFSFGVDEQLASSRGLYTRFPQGYRRFDSFRRQFKQSFSATRKIVRSHRRQSRSRDSRLLATSPTRANRTARDTCWIFVSGVYFPWDKCNSLKANT